MPPDQSKPFILVDGSSYLFRAYHALPPLANSKGEPTGAIYGVLNMLKKLMKEYQPQHIAVVFDPKGKTFRHKLYPDYKANRTVMPDELRVQIQPLFTAIKALGLPLVVVDEVEADDVIGTLAIGMEKKGYPVVISTGDKDMAQLVNDKITLINTMTEEMLDPEGVFKKFGVPPHLIIDYLSLMGDTSDNIPGVPKVGPKTAAKWLNEFGSLANIVKHADQVKGKVGENLRTHLKELPLAQKLVTIKLDVELPFEPEALAPGERDIDTLVKLFQSLEFKNWLTALKAEIGADAQSTAANYQIILKKSQFNDWVKKLKLASCFALDTETTSLDSMQAKLVGLSVAVGANEAAYIPLAHDYLGAPSQLDKNWVLQQLKPLLTDPKKIIVGQNLKYDIKVLKHDGVELEGQLFDTLLESYVLNNASLRHDLDTLAFKYLAHTMITFEDVAGKGSKQLTFNQVPLEQAGPYACEDADITLQLHQTLMSLIKKHSCYEKVLTEIELPLMPILARMEYNGVLIDVRMLKEQSKYLQSEIEKLQEEIYRLSGEDFNIDSPKQLQAILFDKLKLPILKKTPKGQPSTAEAVMQELALDFPLPKLILNYRSLAKIKSTYTDRLPEQINPKTKRVHTHYNQAVTSTGRLSSNNPNLQNIPVRSEQGRKIRQAFIAPKGCQILAADYSQVELRIMAHLSQDEGLLKAFKQNQDIHRATAGEVFAVKLEDVSQEQRRRAKAINFGLIYGMSSFGLSRQLGISQEHAQGYIDIYFSRYPRVHEYMEKARNQAREQGYVETMFGRRLFIPDIKASNLQRRRAAERAAINAPLQGSAADMIKLAMIAIDRWLLTSKIEAKMIMQVHDELVFEVAKKDLNEAKQQIQHDMENAVRLSIPLVVDIGVGDNWDLAH